MTLFIHTRTLLLSILGFLLIFIGASQVSAQQADQTVKTIATLDVPRYLGTWYEIAKFPNWFQKNALVILRRYIQPTLMATFESSIAVKLLMERLQKLKVQLARLVPKTHLDWKCVLPQSGFHFFL